jgi:hypothetical protein
MLKLRGGKVPRYEHWVGCTGGRGSVCWKGTYDKEYITAGVGGRDEMKK